MCPPLGVFRPNVKQTRSPGLDGAVLALNCSTYKGDG